MCFWLPFPRPPHQTFFQVTKALLSIPNSECKSISLLFKIFYLKMQINSKCSKMYLMYKTIKVILKYFETTSWIRHPGPEFFGPNLVILLKFGGKLLFLSFFWKTIGIDKFERWHRFSILIKTVVTGSAQKNLNFWYVFLHFQSFYNF